MATENDKNWDMVLGFELDLQENVSRMVGVEARAKWAEGWIEDEEVETVSIWRLRFGCVGRNKVRR